MLLVDALFLVMLFVVQPVQGRLSYRRFLRAVEAGEPARRLRLYAVTALLQWVALAVLVAYWAWAGRPWRGLGVHAEFGAGFYAMLALGLGAMALMGWSALSVHRMDPAQRRELRGTFGDLVHFLPQSDRELRGFFGLSLTAGVVEELLYRGFVLWVLGQWMPMWLAVLASSVAFGLAHSYQGAGGMLRTGALGLAFALLFVASGSIWLPIVFHALFDIVQGIQVRRVLRDTVDAREVPEAA